MPKFRPDAGIAVAGWLLAIGLQAPAQAQAGFACAALKPSRQQQPAYARVPGEARCEGFFEQGVSQPFVELVSVTRGQARLRMREPVALDASGGGRLLIQPLRAAPFYRVDAEIPVGLPLRWDPAPMLAATGLRPDDLGFLAWANGAPTDVRRVRPVQLASGGRTIYVTVRPSVTMQSLVWRSHVGDAAADAAWQSHPGPMPYAWQTLSLALEPPDAGQWLRVDIRATDRQGEPLPLLSFIVMPP